MEETQIGKYRILAEIGQGAMGQVYRAHDPVLGRDVALKTISAKVGPDEELRKRFHREAQAAARLNHPNIVTVHDFGEAEGQIYIAMELLDGVDLKDFLASGALKSLGAKLEVMEQICDALAFAHSKGVVHRDLKPANVHVLRSGQVKLMDFGLARIGSAADTTKAGTVLGTPNYMSPEQVLGERADFRSDVFSAGALFYEIFAGRKPFDADSVHSVLFQVVHKEPLALRKAAPETPPILVTLVERALSKDPSHRYPDASDLRAALARARASLSGIRSRGSADVEARAPEAGAATPGPAPGGPDAEATLAVPSAARVDGTAALAAKPAPQRTRSTPPTLSARAATKIDPSRARPPVRPPRGAADHAFWRRLAPLGLVLGVASGVGGALLWMDHGATPAVAPSPGTTGPDIDRLTQTLAATHAELAARDLEDKDYRGAIARAEEALKIDPDSSAARDVRGQAQRALADLEAAAGEGREALEAGDTTRASEALSRLLVLDPRHPAAADLSRRLNSVFRAKAEDARRLAAGARAAAEGAQAGTAEAFSRAVQRTREAESLFARGEFASATQGFLEARDGYDRARRAAAARTAATATAPLSARPRPPDTELPRLEAIPAVPPELGLETPAADSAPALPDKPPARPRPFAARRTVVQSARTARGDLSGFESEDVSLRQTPDFVGRIEFVVEPAAVRAGDPYVIRIDLVNDGRKAIDVRSVVVTTTVGTSTSPKDVAPPEKDLEPRQRVTVAEFGGIWEDLGPWTLEAVVTSSKGDTCRNRLEWK